MQDRNRKKVGPKICSNIVSFICSFNYIVTLHENLVKILNANVFSWLYFFQELCLSAKSSLLKEEPMDTVIGRDEALTENRSKESPENYEDRNEQNENYSAVG